jgi:hypothetical protein
MSAFVLSTDHIDLLVTALVRYDVRAPSRAVSGRQDAHGAPGGDAHGGATWHGYRQSARYGQGHDMELRANRRRYVVRTAADFCPA